MGSLLHPVEIIGELHRMTPVHLSTIGSRDEWIGRQAGMSGEQVRQIRCGYRQVKFDEYQSLFFVLTQALEGVGKRHDELRAIHRRIAELHEPRTAQSRVGDPAGLVGVEND